MKFNSALIHRKKKKNNQPTNLLAIGGVSDIIVIFMGNELSDASSNPGRDNLHFTFCANIIGKVMNPIIFPQAIG